MGIRDKFEEHHKCKAAVHLSTRYIADRYLPNKAIDLIDEAGSKAYIEAFKMKKERNSYLLSKKKNQKFIGEKLEWFSPCLKWFRRAS
ncbi:hypothetical protein RYX36_008814 [Vicia faba]